MKAMEQLLVQDPHNVVYSRTYKEVPSILHFQIEETLLERLAGIYNIYIILRHSKIHDRSES